MVGIQDYKFDTEPTLMINGIKYQDDNENLAEISLLLGGVGSPFVLFRIQTMPGQSMRSKFFFYMINANASEPMTETSPVLVEDYLEAEIDLAD